MSDGNTTESAMTWGHEQRIRQSAWQKPPPPRKTKLPGQERDYWEPVWAQPAFESLLGESVRLTEKQVFELGWPSPLPSLPQGLPDRLPVWAQDMAATHDSGPSPHQENGTASAQETEDQSAAWARMQLAFEQDAELTAHVTGYNKGGLLVVVDELQGFVPASQLICFPRHLDSSARDAYLAQQKGTQLAVKVIELEPERNRLVFSERACALENPEGPALMEHMKNGDVVEGLVSNLCDFGAFVDLGGIDGLIHVSEISWQRIGHPSDVLAIGERVKVYVLNVDQEQKRVALSLKRLSKDPWESVAQRYHVGQIVQGVVTNIVDFGAFARVEEGLEGLIHISELAEEEIDHPRALVSEGDELSLRILRIDGPNHRLGLSLKQATSPNDGLSFF